MCRTHYSHTAGVRKKPWFTFQTGDICQNLLFCLCWTLPTHQSWQMTQSVMFDFSERYIRLRRPATCCCRSDWPCVSLRRLVPTSNQGFEARCCAGDVKTEQGGGFGCLWMEKSGADLKRWKLERWHAGIRGQNNQVGLYCTLASLLCSGALC